MTKTKKLKSNYNRRFAEKKRKLGWKFLGFCLPEKIANELQAIKKIRMAEYKKSQEVAQ